MTGEKAHNGDQDSNKRLGNRHLEMARVFCCRLQECSNEERSELIRSLHTLANNAVGSASQI